MNTLKFRLILILALVLPIALSACFFPEDFKSTVEIKKDGTFNIIYEGELTFIPGRAEEIKKGTLSAKSNEEIEELKNTLSKDKGFKHIKYIGHSKFRVLYEKEGALDKPFYFVGKSLRLFSIIPKGEGLIEVQGTELRKKDIHMLTSMKIAINGELTVKTDGEVISHNADSTPSFLGLKSGYSWKITSLTDPQPKILIKIK